MAEPDLIARLATLDALSNVPRPELEWLAEHGRVEKLQPGDVIGPKGQRLRNMWLIISGAITISVDRGIGPKHVMKWRPGEVTGMLPYSRMTGPPGDNTAAETTEVLSIHEDNFPEMIHRCPVFTANTVHLMLDRARSFTASALQDEKMISLGRLSAGLAHELNNPASATVRSAKLLAASLEQAEATARALEAAGLSAEAMDTLERVRSACQAIPTQGVLSPIEQAEREEAIEDWLTQRELDSAHAQALADTAITVEALEALDEVVPAAALDAVLQWIAAGCTSHSLVHDIEHGATRIYELVAAVKRFTFMDQLAGPEAVDVEPGLRDTLTVLAAKAKSMGAGMTLEIAPDLPRVRASGGELNQIWMNLIDNALDAIPESGRIEISVRRELDRVVVRVVDDGPGIPADVLPRIFDPFFTTKPPGEGTGLGLEITRQLVRRNRGDITVQSQPGRTEFAVSLVTVPPA